MSDSNEKSLRKEERRKRIKWLLMLVLFALLSAGASVFLCQLWLQGAAGFELSGRKLAEIYLVLVVGQIGCVFVMSTLYTMVESMAINCRIN